MTATLWSPEDTTRARTIWEDYCRSHDLAVQAGQTVAIDPNTGEVWIAEDPVAIADVPERGGGLRPVYLIRVGFDYFQRKGR